MPGVQLAVPSVGYGAVYVIEIVLLFATLAAIGPLAAGPRFQIPAFPAASRPLGGSPT